MLFVIYSIYGCATETCDARSRWSFMRELHSIMEFVKVEVCPRFVGQTSFVFTT